MKFTVNLKGFKKSSDDYNYFIQKQLQDAAADHFMVADLSDVVVRPCKTVGPLQRDGDRYVLRDGKSGFQVNVDGAIVHVTRGDDGRVNVRLDDSKRVIDVA